MGRIQTVAIILIVNLVTIGYGLPFFGSRKASNASTPQPSQSPSPPKTGLMSKIKKIISHTSSQPKNGAQNPAQHGAQNPAPQTKYGFLSYIKDVSYNWGRALHLYNNDMQTMQRFMEFLSSPEFQASQNTAEEQSKTLLERHIGAFLDILNRRHSKVQNRLELSLIFTIAYRIQLSLPHAKLAHIGATWHQMVIPELNRVYKENEATIKQFPQNTDLSELIDSIQRKVLELAIALGKIRDEFTITTPMQGTTQKLPWHARVVKFVADKRKSPLSEQEPAAVECDDSCKNILRQTLLFKMTDLLGTYNLYVEKGLKTEDSQEACSVHQLVEYIDWLELEYADAMKRTLRPAHANCALRGPLTASNGFQPMAPSEFVSSPATPSTGEPTASATNPTHPSNSRMGPGPRFPQAPHDYHNTGVRIPPNGAGPMGFPQHSSGSHSAIEHEHDHGSNRVRDSTAPIPDATGPMDYSSPDSSSADSTRDNHEPYTPGSSSPPKFDSTPEMKTTPATDTPTTKETPRGNETPAQETFDF